MFPLCTSWVTSSLKRKLQADPAKVQAVAEWPTPSSRKELQRFLGFANFYLRFIRDYSKVAGALTRLTSPVHPFQWTPEAAAAFSHLKTLCTSAPVLRHPDPALQFIVEVDASDIGAGAVLSHRDPQTQRIHPCAFFSRRLSSAERNYDVGNGEFLAVVWGTGWRARRSPLSSGPTTRTSPIREEAKPPPGSLISVFEPI